MPTSLDLKLIKKAVSEDLVADLGAGDLSAALIPMDQNIKATVMTRESMILCGKAWVEEVFTYLDPRVKCIWKLEEGERAEPNQIFLELEGPARALLSGERAALNWLQTLSGTATTVRSYVDILKGTSTQLLDTRKTIPGLRLAQKYAVHCGGGKNHRMGLYDAYLLKENHIMAAGSVGEAILRARRASPEQLIEIEVESLRELEEALLHKVDVVMLDNFNLAEMREAVLFNQGRAKLEVSGNVNLETLRSIAETGVDYISVGALTKHLHAIDLSMRFVDR